jgi:hypothetical protein
MAVFNALVSYKLMDRKPLYKHGKGDSSSEKKVADFDTVHKCDKSGLLSTNN